MSARRNRTFIMLPALILAAASTVSAAQHLQVNGLREEVGGDMLSSYFNVNAVKGDDGKVNGQFRLKHTLDGDVFAMETGTLTCMAIEGNRAVIAVEFTRRTYLDGSSQGHHRDTFLDGPRAGEWKFVYFMDNREANPGHAAAEPDGPVDQWVPTVENPLPGGSPDECPSPAAWGGPWLPLVGDVRISE